MRLLSCDNVEQSFLHELTQPIAHLFYTNYLSLLHIIFYTNKLSLLHIFFSRINSAYCTSFFTRINSAYCTSWQPCRYREQVPANNNCLIILRVVYLFFTPTKDGLAGICAVNGACQIVLGDSTWSNKALLPGLS